MNLPRLSIERHVLAWMMNAVLVLFGLVALDRLGMDRFPRIDFPVISVTTTLSGANPEVVDASITNIIESAVNSVPGIDSVMSNSVPSTSIVAIQFNLDKDIDVAFNEVQAKVNQVLRQLPEDADPPIVAKVETDASPIMWISLTGDRTHQQLNQYARNVMKKALETIDGVGEVRLGGRLDRTIRINLHPARLAALDLTVQDIAGAFEREHFQLPGGFLVSGATEQLIKLDLEYHAAADFGRLVIAHRDGATIRLGDVADIEDGLEDFRRLARFNGEPTVGLGIVKVAGANTVAIVDEVRRRLEEELIPQLPPGLQATIASDQSVFIREMVSALLDKIFLGTLLAALVVLLFLKNFRATIIVALAIPVSLLGAVAVMYFFDYTFNSLTLLALLLLIGVVVDDAIVVLENIYRHRETVEPDPIQGALIGTQQVVFAILATTLSLVAIFAPVAFMGGIIGRFFESFAVVVAVGVLISYFVAVTLTPMLCSRYLRVAETHGRVYWILENGFRAMDRGYRWLLDRALRFRWTTVAVTSLIVLSSAWFFQATGKAFAPEEDEGQFVVIMRAPLGVGIEYMDARLREVEAVLADEPSVRNYFTAIGLGEQGQVNQAFAFVRMLPREARRIRQQDLLPQVNERLSRIPGLRAFATPVPIIGGQRGDPLQFVIRGPDLDRVAELARRVEARLGEEHPELGRVDLDLHLELPQLVLEVDRERSASLGLSSRDVAFAANVLAGGVDIAKYNDEPGDGERYDIRLKAATGEFIVPEDLRRIFVRSDTGDMLRLDTVARLEEVIAPAVISRYNLQYSANFYATPDIALGAAVDVVRRIAAEELPLGYTVRLLGEAEEFEKTTGYIGFVFILATLLVYMVLASQFNSFVQPFIIMMAQPLAVVGGLVALWATGHTLNIFSMIGMILLIGLVAKNSILLVDLTNQYRAEGKGVDEALRLACPIRMRPVLMTSLTLILALLPAATGLGAGADTIGPLAVAVIGGMISSTLLALVVVPVVYSLIENAFERRRHRREAAA